LTTRERTGLVVADLYAISQRATGALIKAAWALYPRACGVVQAAFQAHTRQALARDDRRDKVAPKRGKRKAVPT
jgi:hypothetical protein